MTFTKPSEGGSTWEIPVYDLTAMGLPAVNLGGSQVEVAVDTTAIRADMDKGPIKVYLSMASSTATMPGWVVITPMYVDALDTYQSVVFIAFGTNYFEIDLNFEAARIFARSKQLTL